jgi:hypothetical protein
MKALNRYTKIKTLDFALQDSDNLTRKTINRPDKVNAEIAHQSLALFAKRPNEAHQY